MGPKNIGEHGILCLVGRGVSVVEETRTRLLIMGAEIGAYGTGNCLRAGYRVNRGGQEERGVLLDRVGTFVIGEHRKKNARIRGEKVLFRCLAF